MDLPQFMIRSRGILLSSNFGIHFLFDTAEYDNFIEKYSEPTITYIFNGKEYSAKIVDIAIKNVKYKGFTVSDIPAKDIDMMIDITIKYNSVILDRYSDSIQAALSQAASGEFDEGFKNVANSILEYSKFASEYFGKASSISCESMEFVGIDKFEAVNNDFSEIKEAMICGLSLILKDRIIMNFWVDAGKKDISGARVFIDGKDVTASANLHKNGNYYNFSFSCGEGLMAKILNAHLEDASGNRISNIYNASAAGYCIDVINNPASFPGLVPLAKKILNYIYYSDLYFQNQSDIEYKLEEDEMKPLFHN